MTLYEFEIGKPSGAWCGLFSKYREELETAIFFDDLANKAIENGLFKTLFNSDLKNELKEGAYKKACRFLEYALKANECYVRPTMERNFLCIEAMTLEKALEKKDNFARQVDRQFELFNSELRFCSSEIPEHEIIKHIESEKANSN